MLAMVESRGNTYIIDDHRDFPTKIKAFFDPAISKVVICDGAVECPQTMRHRFPNMENMEADFFAVSTQRAISPTIHSKDLFKILRGDYDKEFAEIVRLDFDLMLKNLNPPEHLSGLIVSAWIFTRPIAGHWRLEPIRDITPKTMLDILIEISDQGAYVKEKWFGNGGLPSMRDGMEATEINLRECCQFEEAG